MKILRFVAISFLFFISIDYMNSIENLFYGIYCMTTNEQKYNLFLFIFNKMAMRNEPCKIDLFISVTHFLELVRPKPKNHKFSSLT